ncbi:MAG TPA: hypothetical protein VNN10_05240 [Dehalococcoidia bacterium]|nr:hypothetical protein [Dehalococcoidia bacterium]
MKAGNPLLGSEVVRFWLACAIAVEVVILALVAITPVGDEADKAGVSRAGGRLLLDSWPFLALGVIYAMAAIALVWELDERAAVLRALFYGLISAVIVGNVASFIRSGERLLQAPTSSRVFTLAYSEILAAVVVVPALVAVLFLGLWPLLRLPLRRAGSLVHLPHPGRHPRGGDDNGAPPVAPT